VLAVDDLSDALFAEGVATLGHVGISERLHADRALTRLCEDLIDGDFDRLFNHILNF
jgi:hypothetical protein